MNFRLPRISPLISGTTPAAVIANKNQNGDPLRAANILMRGDGLYRGFGYSKVQVGKDQEKAQSEKDAHPKNRGGKKPN